MKRTEIINGIIKKHGFKSYLEIGVNDGKNLNAIECENKYGTDIADLSHLKIDAALYYKTSSDDFFNALGDGMSENVTDFPTHYDCIFIDGDHTYNQSNKDLGNSLRHLKEGGLILLHDTNPNNIKEITPNNNGKAWCGEVWKTVLKAQNEGYKIQTIPDDYGITIISGEITSTNNHSLPNSSQDFLKDKSSLLNFISYNDYIKSCDTPKAKDTNDIQIDDINNMTDEELKDFYKAVYGKKPKGRFIRENIIDRLIN